MKITSYSPTEPRTSDCLAGGRRYSHYRFDDGQTVSLCETEAPVFSPPVADIDNREEYLAAIRDAHECEELKRDIMRLYELGYSKPLRALPNPMPNELTSDVYRNALRAAGFTDTEIDQRDYSRGDCE